MKKRILIADDEPDVLEILEKKFKQNDFDVVVSPNGEKAIRKCKAYLPDLVILDIVLGDIDGYTIASMIRQESDLAGIPIIFMTAKDLNSEGIEKRLSELGNCGFIGKPCSFEELLGKVNGLLK